MSQNENAMGQINLHDCQIAKPEKDSGDSWNVSCQQPEVVHLQCLIFEGLKFDSLTEQCSCESQTGYAVSSYEHLFIKMDVKNNYLSMRCFVADVFCFICIFK